MTVSPATIIITTLVTSAVASSGGIPCTLLHYAMQTMLYTYVHIRLV